MSNPHRRQTQNGEKFCSWDGEPWPCVTIRALDPQISHLLAIWRNIRSLGDIPIVYMDEEGAGRTGHTLADELWLIAYNLDSETATAATKEDQP